MSTHPDFPLLDEPLALDLVNTRVRRQSAEIELLTTPTALLAWLRAERARVAWHGVPDIEDLRAVCALRDAIDALLRARRAHARPACTAVARLNHALEPDGACTRLGWAATGPVLKAPPAATQRAAVLRELAADALALLTGPLADRVRECAHPDCRLQFVARNPRRRWCSSASCGNRARVAQHYERHHRAS